MSMLGYLRLVRLPNVFTALADILAGFVILRSLNGQSGFAGTGADWLPFAALCGASAALYLSGMALNDVVDRRDDAIERPQRPIPSGQVSLAGAIVCGLGLMAAGLALAYSVGNFSLHRAAVIAIAVLYYNFVAKHSAIKGPLVLGLCRGANLQLGMTAHSSFPYILRDSVFFDPVWAAPAAVGIYAAGLTAFSAQEESGHRSRAILLGWFFCGSGIALAGLAGAFSRDFARLAEPHATVRAAWIVLIPLALLLLHLTRKLRRSGSPLDARNLVRAGVMGICVLDAGLILGCGGPGAWPLAATSIALLAPALLLAKLLAQKEA